jgi:hypothetical protein
MKFIKEIWIRFLTWRDDRRFKEAKLALGILLMKKDPKIYGEMHKAADAMARQMCCQWLDNRRINHCALCPNTGTLLAYQGRYFCKGHFPKDAKTGIEIVGVK